MSYLKVRRKAVNRVNVPNFLSGINSAYDQSILSNGIAASCYNFDFTSGALKGCPGFENIGINADSIWTYRTGSGKKYLMYSYAGDVFYRDESGVEKRLEGIKLTGVPKAIGYRLYGEDVALICSPTDNMVVWNGVDEAYYVASSPLITSMAMHFERLFVTTSDEVNTLWFSDDLDPTNWNTDMSEGGFIELVDERGALIKAISFLNYVYIFRERGISRLTAYADQTEFSVSNLFVTGGEIYPGSIALCGDKVIFASSDGLFMFDGMTTTRILGNLDGLLQPDGNSVAAYHDGKYYLALKAKFDDNDGFEGEFVNNAVLIYGDNGYTLMRGYDVSDFYSSGDTLYAIINGKAHTLGGECPLFKRWRTPVNDLGSGKLKMIRTLYIDTKTDITLRIHLDGAEKELKVKGKETTSRVNINMPCRKFGMTIDCDCENPNISRPQLTFSFADV